MKYSRHEAPAPDPVLEQFADRMGAVMPRIMRGLLGQDRSSLARGEITVPQMWLLQLVREHRACTMGELARLLRMGPSTATGHADRLVRMGLLRRAPDPADRRAVRVALTPRGTRMLAGFEAERRRLTLGMFACVSAGDRRTYLRVLERVAENLDHLNADRSPQAGAA